MVNINIIFDFQFCLRIVFLATVREMNTLFNFQYGAKVLGHHLIFIKF